MNPQSPPSDPSDQESKHLRVYHVQVQLTNRLVKNPGTHRVYPRTIGVTTSLVPVIGTTRIRPLRVRDPSYYKTRDTGHPSEALHNLTNMKPLISQRTWVHDLCTSLRPISTTTLRCRGSPSHRYNYFKDPTPPMSIMNRIPSYFRPQPRMITQNYKFDIRVTLTYINIKSP